MFRWITQFVLTVHSACFEPGQLSRYSDPLWVGRSGIQIPARPRDFFLQIPSSLKLLPTQPPIQWAPGYVPGSKVAGT